MASYRDVCFRSRVAADHCREGSLITTRKPERRRVRVQRVTCSASKPAFLLPPSDIPKCRPWCSGRGSASSLDFGDDVCTDLCHVRETTAALPKENRATYLLGTETVLCTTSTSGSSRRARNPRSSSYNTTTFPSPVSRNSEKTSPLRPHVRAAFAPSLLNPGPTPLAPSNDPSITTPPSLTVIRTSIFGAACAIMPPLMPRRRKISPNTVENGLAVLSLPSLDPPTLNAILNALQKSVPPLKPGEKAQASPSKKPSADDPDFVPGRRVKRAKPTRTPELTVMGALIEGRVFKTGGCPRCRVPTNARHASCPVDRIDQFPSRSNRWYIGSSERWTAREDFGGFQEEFGGRRG
jgi:hypothetical protein